MVNDALDLQAAMIVKSPDVAAWPATLRITRVSCTPAGGFIVEFDRPVPESWKWPSNPLVPSENYQWTFWWFKRIAGLIYGAGFVQMWQNRPQGTRALPPLFADVDGAPGWTRLWGEGQKWPALASDPPRNNETMWIMASAGNGRQTEGITSVAERSNIVPWTVRSDDTGDALFLDAPPVVDPPPSVPPVAPPTVGGDLLLALAQRLAAVEGKLGILNTSFAALTDALVAVRAPAYTGSMTAARKIALKPVVPTGPARKGKS